MTELLGGGLDGVVTNVRVDNLNFNSLSTTLSATFFCSPLLKFAKFLTDKILNYVSILEIFLESKKKYFKSSSNKKNKSKILTSREDILQIPVTFSNKNLRSHFAILPIIFINTILFVLPDIIYTPDSTTKQLMFHHITKLSR